MNKNRDNYQLFLKYNLLTDGKNYIVENGKIPFTIVDGSQPLKEAHIFYKGNVTYNEDEQVMVKEMFENYCDWLAKNRNVIANYYEQKQS